MSAAAPWTHVARVDEPRCVGCTLCILACPFDAIVGAHRMMHTVIAELCTGCDLCLAPCPMDCIVRVTVSAPAPAERRALALAARDRARARIARHARDRAEREARLAARAGEYERGQAR